MARPRFITMALAFLLGAVGISSTFGQRYAGDAYFPGYYSPSTAGESLARGRADVIRSQGQYLLDSSQAASQFEDARSKNIDNRYKATQAYFDLRKMNREYRAAEALPKPTQEDLVRWAQAGAPKDLTSSELNPNNGELLWPLALTSNVFDENRKVVDLLMGERAKYGSLNFDQVQKVESNVATMKAGIKDRIKEYTPNNYLEAKKFLESLAYEIRQ